MPQRATWKKAERLKSRKRIERVFREGKSFSVFPFKVVFLVSPAGGAGGHRAAQTSGSPARGGDQVAQAAARQKGDGHVPDSLEGMPLAAGQVSKAPRPGKPEKTPIAPVQAGFGAATRNFKKAVDRNRIKRLSREAYRLQKGPLLEQLARKGLSMAVFFVFIGKVLPDYPIVSARIGVALQKLLKETA